MSKEEIKLNVFVASPSDVNGEREIVSAICMELNSIWGDLLGLNLNLIRWETHTYPAVSEYAQNAINEQLDDYDIFIALFWNRFGTPTKVALSGTEEELNIAIEIYKKQNKSLDIMVYFKEQTTDNSNREQQKNVNILKEKIEKNGSIYYRTFRELKDFESLLRMNLSFVAQKWAKKYSLNDMDRAINKTFSKIELDGLNLSDYYSIVEARSAVLAKLTSNIATMYKFNMDEFKKFIEKVKDLLGESDILVMQSHLLRYIKIYLMSVEDTTNVINSQIKPLIHARGVFFETLSKIISFEIGTAGNERISIIRNVVNSLKQQHVATSSMMKNDINNLETDSYFKNNLQMKNYIKSLSSFKEEIDEFIVLSTTLLNIIDEFK
jgi:hypothetical protein